MVLVFIEPLDFQNIIMNYLIGSTELFIFVFILVTSYLSARLNLSNKSFMIVLAVGSIMFATYLGQSIYVLVIFIIGITSFSVIKRFVT